MSSPEYADFYFIGMRRNRSKTDRRVDGFFVIPQTGFTCRACSGSTSLSPLPPGRYLANNFRTRTDLAMVRDGVGFSVDLEDKYDPTLGRMRSLLRIHPDGNKPGTQGCVGILDKVAECRDQLQALVPGGASRYLEVIVAERPEDMVLCTEYGCFIWA